jgi:flagellar biosynthesis GTPase FlhF
LFRLAQEAEDLKRKLLFELVSKGHSREFIELVEQPMSGVKISDRIGSGGRSGAGLLHFCVAVYKGSDGKTVDSHEIQEGKLAIAKYLLTFRSSSLDLGLIDDEGRTVLHVAAMYGDAHLIEFLVEQRSEQEKKIHTIDINSRCLNQGWTPLHYAANYGVIAVVQLLVRLGAILNVHAFVYSPSSTAKDSDNKGPTPLELARKRMRLRNLPQAEFRSLESVVAELEKALHRLEALRQQREAEKSNKESKLKEEKQRLAEKEQTERELLERKQKQLREKQEKERIKNEEDTRRGPPLSLH